MLGEVPVETLIARKRADFETYARGVRAEKWHSISVPNDGLPFGIAWVGDPHLEDDGTDWPTLQRDIALIADAPAVYGACIGDVTNNWVGSLVRLWGDSRSTKRDAQRLAGWFLNECGVDWRVCILGNHDLWNDGEAIYGLIAPNATYLAAWAAHLEIKQGAQSWRIRAAHDFKGSSVHNETHGISRAAIFSGGDADLYVAGHRHRCASQAFEAGGRFVRTVRAAGYKVIDRHALVNGYSAASCGQSVLAIFDPQAGLAGRVTVCEDLAQGVEMLTAIREYRANGKRPASPKTAPAKRGKARRD